MLALRHGSSPFNVRPDATMAALLHANPLPRAIANETLKARICRCGS
ncbi:hypothetical protein LMG24076_00411 [Trinickia soli]|nr:hypothetical protein LMG24076_00411 [Trinickia soli]